MIELTLTSGNKIYFHFIPVMEVLLQGGTLVHYHERTFHVHETPETILDLVEEQNLKELQDMNFSLLDESDDDDPANFWKENL